MSRSLQQIIQECRQQPLAVDILTEDDVWQCLGTQIWCAKSFNGSPSFYPIYRRNDLYSFSPLALILHKGYLSLNSHVIDDSARDGFLYYSGPETVDTEITRIGGPLKPHFTIRSTHEYIGAICAAMKDDVARVENRYPEYTNIILTGGKDSENLALLPWKNPTIILSGPPNYELNVQFAKENRLPYRVLPLYEYDYSTKDIEAAENSCRMSLVHARWTSRLRLLVEEHNGRVIFWAGQVADAFTTPYWRTLVIPGQDPDAWPRRLRPYRVRAKLQELWARHGFLQKRFFEALWYRCAMWQGTHMSVVRQATGALMLSAYHGSEMQKVLANVDLYSTVKEDIRPQIGESLFGRKVWYPSINPSPPPSVFRADWSSPSEFLNLLKANSIEIRE